jgi:hypothetical protein
MKIYLGEFNKTDFFRKMNMLHTDSMLPLPSGFIKVFLAIQIIVSWFILYRKNHSEAMK